MTEELHLSDEPDAAPDDLHYGDDQALPDQPLGEPAAPDDLHYGEEVKPTLAPDFDRDPMSRLQIDAKSPVAEMRAVAEKRIDDEIARIEAAQDRLGSEAMYTREYTALNQEKFNLQEARRLLADRVKAVSEHADAGTLSQDVLSYTKRLKQAQSQNLDRLEEVTPRGVRHTGTRVIEGPLPHERSAINAAEADVKDYSKDIMIAELLDRYLPKATVPSKAA